MTSPKNSRRKTRAIAQALAIASATLSIPFVAILISVSSALKTQWALILGAVAGLAFSESIGAIRWSALGAPKSASSGQSALRKVHRRLGHHWARWWTPYTCEEEAQQLVREPQPDVPHCRSHPHSESRQKQPSRSFSGPLRKHKLQHFRRCLLSVAVIVWILVFVTAAIAYVATLRSELHPSDASPWSLLDTNIKTASLSTRQFGLLATVIGLMSVILLALITRLAIYIRWK